ELVARSRSIALALVLPERPLVVEGDLVRLEEIFNNLLGNAPKYSPDGARSDVRVADEGGCYAGEAADSGIGLAPALPPRAFEQAAPSIDRRAGGLGLGLTLVRALVELHDGTIEAHSDGLGRGSRFTVRLRPTLATLAPATTDAAPVRTGPVTLVLVEDNADL